MAHHCPEDLFIAVVSLSGSFAIMVTINGSWPCLPLSWALMAWFAVSKNRRMQAAFREMRPGTDINAQVEDSISGVCVVKSSPTSGRRKNSRENINFRQSKQDAFHVMAQFFSGVNLFSNLINLVVVLFGGLLIYRGTMTLGTLVGFLLYVNMFMMPIRRLTMLVELYQRGVAGFRRFEETTSNPRLDRRAPEAGRLAGEIVSTAFPL